MRGFANDRDQVMIEPGGIGSVEDTDVVCAEGSPGRSSVVGDRSDGLGNVASEN